MNEQIKKLLGQALDSAVPETWTTLTPEQLEKVSHKLAELIVGECTNIALEQKRWVEGQQVFNTLDETWNRARIQQSQHIADKINEHFGVEQ